MSVQNIDIIMCWVVLGGEKNDAKVKITRTLKTI